MSFKSFFADAQTRNVHLHTSLISVLDSKAAKIAALKEMMKVEKCWCGVEVSTDIKKEVMLFVPIFYLANITDEEAAIIHEYLLEPNI